MSAFGNGEMGPAPALGCGIRPGRRQGQGVPRPLAAGRDWGGYGGTTGHWLVPAGNTLVYAYLQLQHFYEQCVHVWPKVLAKNFVGLFSPFK